MTQPDTPALAGMSIGAVLDLLRPDFPDVTISKIRFLEAEGLVTPERTASGYRRFTAYDCARLRFVLTAQRDQYLPLKVIKSQLDAQPDGELPELDPPTGCRDWCRYRRTDPTTPTTRRRSRPPQVRLSREDLLTRSGVDAELLSALVKAGMIKPGPAGFFDEHTVVTAQCAQCARRVRRRAAPLARVPIGGGPAIRPDRPDRGSVVKAGRRARVTAPTNWLARWRRWRSRCTRR